MPRATSWRPAHRACVRLATMPEGAFETIKASFKGPAVERPAV